MKIPRLMAFDLDGTLAESKQRLSEDMGEILTRLLQRMPIAVMSGAGFTQLEKQFLDALPEGINLSHLYIFPTNAAQCFVWRENGWKPQYDHTFSDEELEEIYAALDAALDEVGMKEPPAQTWGERIENRNGGQVSFSPLGQQAPVEEKRKWNASYNDSRKKLREVLMQKLPGFTVSMGGLTTIDITHEGIDKAYGVKRLSELTQIPVDEMLYVGDALEEGGNDSVVIATGIPTHPVLGPQETQGLIEEILSARVQ